MKISLRKPFKMSTRKMEWMDAAGKNPLKWRNNFTKISFCRVCHMKLTWGDRSYEFDHKDNDPSNNTQNNCYLVCRICHAKATKIRKRKIRDKLSGKVIGYKTIKGKPGYKRNRKKKKQTKRKTKKQSNLFDVKLPQFKLPKI